MQYGLPFQAVFRSTDPRIRNKIMTGILYVLISTISVRFAGRSCRFLHSGWIFPTSVAQCPNQSGTPHPGMGSVAD